MRVYLNEISGLWQAIISMYMSKRTWSRSKEETTKKLYSRLYDGFGLHRDMVDARDAVEMDKQIRILLKWAPIHITMTKFLDFSFSVEGLHRGGQDDLDSHAKRMDNRILRSSTRLATYGAAKSDWYKDKILTTDEALELQGIKLPEELCINGIEYVRAVNGYVRKGAEEDKDVKRGLYMLSIPSDCTFRINCSEFAHLLKQRDMNSHAHPELKLAVEMMLAQIQQHIPQLTREWFYSVEN